MYIDQSVVFDEELADVLEYPLPAAELVLDEQAADWVNAAALGEEVESELAAGLRVHLAEVVAGYAADKQVAHLLLLDAERDLHGRGREVVQAELDRLRLLQLQQLLRGTRDHVQVDLKFWTATTLLA